MTSEQASSSLTPGPPGIWPQDPPRVAFVDNHCLVLIKPFNMPVMGDASGDMDLLEWGRQWVQTEFHKPGAAWLGLVHRLDRPAAGLVLLARTSKAAARLSGQFRRHTVKKTYRAWLQGSLEVSAGQLVNFLAKNRVLNRVDVVGAKHPEALEARLSYRLLDQRQDALGQWRSEVEIDLETGRPHQIRAQFAKMHFPLLGDLKYGAKAALPGRHLALFAWGLEFGHPVGGGRVRLEAPLPSNWTDL